MKSVGENTYGLKDIAKYVNYPTSNKRYGMLHDAIFRGA